ncbi:MAG: SdpI family protein [Holophagales bacterium]|nr:SdpI family protein [Holophagales bacterium]
MNAPEPAYRVDRALLKGDAPLLAILLADLAFGLWVLPRLPEKVPVHWNLAGEADRFGPAWQNALLLPALAFSLWAVLLFLPLADPLRKNYPRFPATLKLFRWLVPLLVVGLQVLVALSQLGVPLDPGQGGRAILAVVFVILGNSMGKLRHNWFVGIRTPWTIASEEVWTRTHRLAAPIWVAGGIVQLFAAFVPGVAGEALYAAPLAAMILVPVVYSFVVYRRLTS